jgi:hypothetical protein
MNNLRLEKKERKKTTGVQQHYPCFTHVYTSSTYNDTILAKPN